MSIDPTKLPYAPRRKPSQRPDKPLPAPPPDEDVAATSAFERAQAFTTQDALSVFGCAAQADDVEAGIGGFWRCCGSSITACDFTCDFAEPTPGCRCGLAIGPSSSTC
jgi:hypothetical protein